MESMLLAWRSANAFVDMGESPQRLKPRLSLWQLRRGLKPRPFKAEPQADSLRGICSATAGVRRHSTTREGWSKSCSRKTEAGVETPCEPGSADGARDPSTTAVLRVREAQPPLRMTGFRGSSNYRGSGWDLRQVAVCRFRSGRKCGSGGGLRCCRR